MTFLSPSAGIASHRWQSPRSVGRLVGRGTTRSRNGCTPAGPPARQSCRTNDRCDEDAYYYRLCSCFSYTDGTCSINLSATAMEAHNKQIGVIYASMHIRAAAAIYALPRNRRCGRCERLLRKGAGRVREKASQRITLSKARPARMYRPTPCVRALFVPPIKISLSHGHLSRSYGTLTLIKIRRFPRGAMTLNRLV